MSNAAVSTPAHTANVYTRNDIAAILNDQTPSKQYPGATRGDVASMRAVCRIAGLQTAAELAALATTESNGVGFNGAHAATGVRLARWMAWNGAIGEMNRRVGGLQTFRGVKTDRVEICREIALAYTRQLADAANAK